MAIHLTPTELAREAGLERREVIEKCMEMGVPIFQGRIDKTLFLASVEEQSTVSVAAAGAAALSAPLWVGSPPRLFEEEQGMQETTAGLTHGGTGSVTIADIVGLAAER